jgi:hypothetical protein
MKIGPAISNIITSALTANAGRKAGTLTAIDKINGIAPLPAPQYGCLRIISGHPGTTEDCASPNQNLSPPLAHRPPPR